jgi:ATP-dependent RNA helicase DDX27
MAVDDFIMTIDSDAEDPPSIKANKSAKATKSSAVDVEGAHLNPEFSFDLSNDAYTVILGYENDLRDLVKTGSKPVSSYPMLLNETHRFEFI